MGAFGRFFSTLWARITGRVDAKTDAMMTDQYVVRSKFDDIIRAKTDAIQQLKGAVAALKGQRASNIEALKKLSEEMKEMELDLAGAQAAAKNRAAKLAGKTEDEIMADPEVMEAMQYYNDTEARMEEMKARATALEERVSGLDTSINDHMLQLKQMVRDLEGLRTEKEDTAADVIANKEIRAANDMIAGIADDGSAKELQALREARQKLNADAQISKELAGTDAKAQQQKFRSAARSSAGRDKFAAMIGVAAKAEAATPVTPTAEKPASTSGLN